MAACRSASRTAASRTTTGASSPATARSRSSFRRLRCGARRSHRRRARLGARATRLGHRSRARRRSVRALGDGGRALRLRTETADHASALVVRDGSLPPRASRRRYAKLGDSAKLERLTRGSSAMRRRTAIGVDRRIPIPASTNASCRSRHLLQTPQCASAAGIHARQGQFEREPERHAAPDDFGLAERARTAPRFRSACARPSESAAAMAARNSGVASGNGLWSSVPSTIRGHARAGAVHRRLAQQHDVPAREIHVFVGRVIAGRTSDERPVRGG